MRSDSVARGSDPYVVDEIVQASNQYTRATCRGAGDRTLAPSLPPRPAAADRTAPLARRRPRARRKTGTGEPIDLPMVEISAPSSTARALAGRAVARRSIAGSIRVYYRGTGPKPVRVAAACTAGFARARGRILAVYVRRTIMALMSAGGRGIATRKMCAHPVTRHYHAIVLL